MRALTICQPYAHLIVTGEKRVENRSWFTRYRGPLLIHAGKSHDWLVDSRTTDMAFGALVGVANLVDCVHIDEIDALPHCENYPWLGSHPHTSGPWCWVLDAAQRYKTPIKMKGAQGLWNVRGAGLPDIVEKFSNRPGGQSNE